MVSSRASNNPRQHALKTNVYADNYQGFNTSIGSYRSVVQHVSNSQNNVNAAKELLIKAQGELATKRPVLKELRQTSNDYSQMIQILDDIEILKAVPDKLEQQISQKYFMSAHTTLADALRTAEKDNLQSLATLKPIKSYLTQQETQLFSTLMSELNNHIYLKSPYCDSRWHAYRQAGGTFGSLEQALEDKIRFDLSEKSSSFSETSLLDTFLASANSEFVEEQNENAEENSFYYIRLLMETLGNLNRLPNAFDILLHELPIELHKIVEKTIAEVSQRFPKSFNIPSSKSPYAVFEIGLSAGDNRLAALKDLTWTLYSKFIAVLQAHRVIYEVAQNIYGNHGTQEKEGPPPYDFSTVYSMVEKEVNALLSTYVVDKSISATSNQSNKSIKLALNKGAGILEKRPRDKTKPIFKFTSIDTKQHELKEQNDILKQAFEKSVPGLVSSAGNTDYDETFNPYLSTESSATHTLLVTPSFFNIRVMLEPTVQFLQKASTVFPPKVLKPSGEMIETFLVEMCLPQLEIALSHVYEALLTGPAQGGVDVFEYSNKWHNVSKLPILQAVISFSEMLQRTSALLGMTNLYRKHYVQLVLNLIRRFTSLVKEHYDSKVVYQETSEERNAGYTNGPTKVTTKRKLAATWASSETTRKLLTSASLFEYDEDYSESSTEPPYRPEFDFYHSKRSAQKAKHRTPITENDLLSFSMFQGIAALATSLRWFSVKLRQLRKVGETEKPDDTATGSTLTTTLRRRWILMEEIKSIDSESRSIDDYDVTDLGITLAGESITEFDKEVDSIDQLCETCILTLKADLRCRTIYYIDKTMQEGEYYLPADTDECDSYVGKLDNDIIKCDAVCTEALVEGDKAVINAGLAKFIDELLITSAEGLPHLNEHGVKKMNNNILVLQQMFKSINLTPQSVNFTRSIAFYDLTKSTSQQLLDLATQRKTPFTHDELKCVLRLIRSKTVRRHELSGRRDLMQNEKSALHEDLVKLHDCYWGSEKVEM